MGRWWVMILPEMKGLTLQVCSMYILTLEVICITSIFFSALRLKLQLPTHYNEYTIPEDGMNDKEH